MKRIAALVIAALLLATGLCSCGQSNSVNLCPNCAEICADGAKSCSSCGEIISSTWVCVCGKSNSDYSKICKYCNLDLSSSQDMISRDYNSLLPNSSAGGSSGGSSSSNSSNGSSSGNSSSNSYGEDDERGVKCEFCKGAGISECSGCDGKGLVLKYYSMGSPVYGNCIVCEGNGYKKCPYCKGDGIFGD